MEVIIYDVLPYGLKLCLEEKFHIVESRQIVGLIFSALTMEEFLTSRRLFDVHKGIVKFYLLCCNYIEKFL